MVNAPGSARREITVNENRPDLHPALRRARYGSEGDADRFIGFWLALIMDARQPGHSRIRRTVRDFFAAKELQAALAEAGQQAVDDELTDAATIYWTTCRTDPQYSSKMLGYGRLQPQAIEKKASRELANTVHAMTISKAMTGPAESLGSLLQAGFRTVFGDTAAQAVDQPDPADSD